MEEKKNKCPLCSKRLVMKDGVPTCPDCGYRDPYRSDRNPSQTDYSQPPRMNYGQSSQTAGSGQPNYGQSSQTAGSGQSNYGQSSQPAGSGQPNYGQSSQVAGSGQPNYGQSSQAAGSGQQPNYGRSQSGYGQQPKLGPYAAVVSPSGNDTKKKVNTAAVVIITIVTIIAVMMVLSVIVGLTYFNFATNDQGGTEWSGHWENNIAASSSVADHQESSVPASTQGGVSSVSHLTFDPPESELLQEFVSQLFGKPAASVTRDELNSVIGVKIRDMYNYNGTEVDYKLSDGTTGTCYLSSTRVDSGDFKCFPGIQILDLGRNSLDWDTDWHNLTSLTSLTCRASLEDLAGYMEVSQLTSLSLSRDFMMSDCSGLGAYGNLEYLKLDCDDYSMELTGLSQASSLKTLIIEDADSVTDYRELYDMTQLKEISIESNGLRDIGFISKMSGLESLELISTELLRIDAVSDCADTLKCLRLHRNYSVEDYSAVFECNGLEELELYVDYDFDEEMVMPDLSMMPELKVLTLGNYEKFPGLENLTALESLTLVDGGFYADNGELTGLEKLTGLKSLSLLDMSMEPELLEAFAVVDSLETIDLTGSFVWGDLNAVFGMPDLKTLILDDVDFGLMLSEMPVSESLLELDMTDAHVHQLKEDGSFDYSAGNTRIQLGDHTEFFDHMPNLTSLRVPGQELKDVKFAGNLAQLTYLDITNNYVVDLSPLADLSQLKVIVCENNPVYDMTGLKNVIIID